jgi:hypothetical protein
MTENQLNSIKLIKVGRSLEFYISQKPFIKPDVEPTLYDKVDKYIVNAHKDITKYEPTPDRKLEHKKQAANIAQNNIRRIVQNNFKKNAKFLTFTFNNNQNFDIYSLDICNKVFTNFLRRLRYAYPGIKYIAVAEYQKRGAVHYHMVVEYEYIPQKRLEKIWSHGFISIMKIQKSNKLGAYLSKYLSKDLYTSTSSKTRKYFYSTGLKTPKVYYGIKAYKLYQKLIFAKHKPQYTGSYPTKYHGIIRYIEFNFYEEGG